MAQVQVMSPQMQQSLALLQAPLLDLRGMINKELQENPVLEELSPADQTAEESGERESGESAADTKIDSTTESNGEPVDDFQAEMERLAELSEEWRDHFSASQVMPLQSRTPEDDERRQFLFDSLTASITLSAHLIEQARLSDLDAEEMRIAEEIIGNLDDRGFLQVTVEELVQATGREAEEVEEVISVIRSFEPAGVGAGDLRECLLIQLESTDRIDSQEYQLVENHMDALGRRKFPEIARVMGLQIDEVQDLAENIAALNPNPGRAFLPDSDAMVVSPEVFVEWKEDRWVVISNREEVPQVRISNDYKDMLAQARNSKDVREYIRGKIRDGKFLIKSIHQRQDTILKVATEIVRRQDAFIEEGIGALKPMTMAEIAEAVGVHETTVSRAVSGKYLQTPRGLFEMRQFFTGGIKTTTGQDMSNASVKHMIQELVDDEDKGCPLSDEAIVKVLGGKEVKIARRTVAKYRGELNILPSNMRKVY